MNIGQNKIYWLGVELFEDSQSNHGPVRHTTDHRGVGITLIQPQLNRKVLNHTCQILWVYLSVWLECWCVTNFVGLKDFGWAPLLKSVHTCQWWYASTCTWVRVPLLVWFQARYVCKCECQYWCGFKQGMFVYMEVVTNRQKFQQMELTSLQTKIQEILDGYNNFHTYIVIEYLVYITIIWT